MSETAYRELLARDANRHASPAAHLGTLRLPAAWLRGFLPTNARNAAALLTGGIGIRRHRHRRAPLSPGGSGDGVRFGIAWLPHARPLDFHAAS